MPLTGEEVDLSSQSVITFGHSGGRLGDNLIAYLHAKWISYKTGLPLLANYWGFNHAEEFVLFDKELNLDYTLHPANKIEINQLYRTPKAENEPTTFWIPYFPESSWEWAENGGDWCRFYEVDWKDPVFRKQALEMIAPKNKLQLARPPKGGVSIAIHARDGGNFEYKSPQYDAPLKRPPMSYYRDALQKVVKLFPGKPLYCFIFTDAVEPESIVDMITEGLAPDTPIIIDWRRDATDDPKNVVADFFSLFHYDVLIRPESNFSMVPSLLKDYDVLVVPTHAVSYPEIYIDEMHVQINK